jgi:hypothetical protein
MSDVPQHLGQYVIQRQLGVERKYLATDIGGREVVLEVLSQECLLRGRLHPRIHDRLAKIRELPHLGIANLFSVERDGNVVFIVWEYIRGQNWNEQTPHPTTENEQTDRSQQLKEAIEHLHDLGIVHGRVHERNVIVDETGAVRLTHLNPLFCDDPTEDEHGVFQLCDAAKDAADMENCSQQAELELREQKLQSKQKVHLIATAAMIFICGIGFALAVIHGTSEAGIDQPVPMQAPPEAMHARHQ